MVAASKSSKLWTVIQVFSGNFFRRLRAGSDACFVPATQQRDFINDRNGVGCVNRRTRPTADVLSYKGFDQLKVS
jgi:hypothetical protein